MTLLILTLSGCFGFTTGPCADYCDYVCQCHPDDAGVSCEDCQTIYTDDDAALQDECETALVDLQAADREAGITCEEDTAAAGA